MQEKFENVKIAKVIFESLLSTLPTPTLIKKKINVLYLHWDII